MNAGYWMLLAASAAAALCFGLLQAIPFPVEVCWTAAITLFCATLWITEAMPIPVTALIALALFPAVGVLTPQQLGQAFGSPPVLLLPVCLVWITRGLRHRPPIELPAALTASCAFMLPTATTPNTVAFSTGRFPIRKMASEGIVLNLLGVAVVTLASYLLLYR